MMNIKDCVGKEIVFWWDGLLLFEYFDNMSVLECKVNVFFMMFVNVKYCDFGMMVDGKIEVGVVKKNMSLVMMLCKDKVEVFVVYGEQEDEIQIVQCGD